jgi:hypothetical protein
MTCRNTESSILVRFTVNGIAIDGLIDDAPMGLLSALARTSGGPAWLGRQIAAAERVFVPAFLRERMGR